MITIVFGSKAECSDGSAGKVVGVAVVPETRTASHLVVDGGSHTPQGAVLVPLDKVKSSDSDTIEFDFDRAGLASMDPVVSKRYVALTVNRDIPATSMIGPASYTVASPDMLEGEVDDPRIPEGSVSLGSNTDVITSDDATTKLRGMTLNADGYAIAQIEVETGPIWRRSHHDVSDALVDRIEGNTIYLKLTKSELGEVGASE